MKVLDVSTGLGIGEAELRRGRSRRGLVPVTPLAERYDAARVASRVNDVYEQLASRGPDPQRITSAPVARRTTSSQPSATAH